MRFITGNSEPHGPQDMTANMTRWLRLWPKWPTWPTKGGR